MQKHTKIYYDYFGYGLDDIIPCEVCGSKSVDLHHIEPKGMGGSKTKDNIENLIALCRDCHNKAHAGELSKKLLIEIHQKNIE